MVATICDFRNFNVNNIVFSKPETGSISGSLPKISFKRIRLAARAQDGSVGEFVLISPPNLMCFGLQENIDMGTGAVNGYQFPICLWNRNGASEEERQFVEAFNQITEKCKDYLVDHRDDIEKYDLEKNDLKKFNPLYWKMDKGKIVEDRGPMLYLKVMNTKSTEKIQSFFINDETNTFMDPFELRGKRCHVTVAIKFESIFIGNKISLQIKLKEAVVKLQDTSIRSLLRPNATLTAPTEPSFTAPTETTADAAGLPAATGDAAFEENEEASQSSLLDDEEEEEEEEEEEDGETDLPVVDHVSASAPAPPAPTPAVSVAETPAAKKTRGRPPKKT